MQFVVGLNFSKVQSRFIQENKLAFKEAIKIAISEDTALSSCKELDSPKSNTPQEECTSGPDPNKTRQQILLEMWATTHTYDRRRFKCVKCHQCSKVESHPKEK
jgi:hypothetical protein